MLIGQLLKHVGVCGCRCVCVSVSSKGVCMLVCVCITDTGGSAYIKVNWSGS